MKRKRKKEKGKYNISLVTFIETLHGNHDTYDDRNRFYFLGRSKEAGEEEREREDGIWNFTLRPSKVNKSSVSHRGIQKF